MSAKIKPNTDAYKLRASLSPLQTPEVWIRNGEKTLPTSGHRSNSDLSAKHGRWSRSASTLPTLRQINSGMPIYETESNPTATFNPKLFLAREPKDPSKCANLFFSPYYSQREEIRPLPTTSQLLWSWSRGPFGQLFFFSKTNLQPIPEEEANLKFNPWIPLLGIYKHILGFTAALSCTDT